MLKVGETVLKVSEKVYEVALLNNALNMRVGEKVYSVALLKMLKLARLGCLKWQVSLVVLRGSGCPTEVMLSLLGNSDDHC